MARSWTRPSTGQFVWYYATTPPTTAPIAALVISTVSKSSFNLAIFDPATGAITAAAAVPFHYGTRPAAGAWCTMMRVNENAAGQWPSNN